ncbi:helix-turn-helix domain-containing protein [Schaalia sp. JY-X169]|uniref:helix-turn-helix domain-containing protein n=1 Tax=Schaalia sp. JY-X169 TaxID=2758572 RepID=UPI0015F71CBB|nr:helix-turn-helix domain-containing protein [Schaalia sp. JY-X169]
MSPADVTRDSRHSTPVDRLLLRLRDAREAAGLSTDELDRELILGPGWVSSFESGETLPDLDTLFVLIERLGVDPVAAFSNLEDDDEEVRPAEMARQIRAEQVNGDLVIHFQYAKYDAQYTLENATLEQFEEVLKALRDGLALLVAARDEDEEELKQIKTSAVAAAFLKAVEIWPEANASDLWWFIIYRAYCDPYNHPAEYARLDFVQSWKRTGGWALEEIMVRHYRGALAERGISIEIANGSRKADLMDQFDVPSRLESDKVDVFLLGPDDRVFGVVHVKASFAERRTDDVPMSEALIAKGYFSPLWTMDCKSTPAARPVNKGELGLVQGRRSAKRKDFEDDGSFSACFSYNGNTLPSLDPDKVAAPIVVCDFSDPDDAFVEHVVAAWKRFAASDRE